MRQTETGIWLFHSHLTEQDAAEHTAALVQQIKKISLHTEIGRSVDYNVSFPTDVVKDPLPVICIINGVGIDQLALRGELVSGLNFLLVYDLIERVYDLLVQ